MRSQRSRWVGLWLGVAFWFTGLADPRVVAQTNLALHQPVTSSGANWGSFKPAALTDGVDSTFTHPLASEGTLGFYYEVDLGAARALDRIVLRNRGDGCCTERLSRFQVEVWTDGGGSPGQRIWSALVRSDGSDSGVGGLDVIIAGSDPAGTFVGRFVRVVNTSGAPYSPQLAEIEVYGGTIPTIRSFTVDVDVLEPGSGTVLRWDVVGATSVGLSPGPDVPLAMAGTLAIAPTVTTTYTLVASNRNGAAQATVTVGVGVALAPPDLTEFVAQNAGGLRDEDGDSSDWIELTNPNAYSLGVGGWYLTDDPADLARWRLPDVRIPARGALLVFASGKNRRELGRELHTGFRLDGEGDFIALVEPDGRTVARQYPTPGEGGASGRFPPQVAGVGYGLGADGRVGFLRPSTPGAANGVAYLGVVADTRFSADRGLYEAPILVELTTATPGAVIRFTTDRTVPTTTHGTVYTSPVSIAKTTVLRAAAFREGWAPTDVDTHTYVFPSDIVKSAVMRTSITTHPVYGGQLGDGLRDLPSFSVVSTAKINDTTEVGASLEWLPTAAEVAAEVGNRGGVQEDCGVQWYGGAFTDFAKKNFRLFFRSQYGSGRFHAPLFTGHEHGLAAVEEFDQLELRSGSHDMSQRGFYLSNIFVDDTLLEMGQLNPHGRFAHLYLNGVYWGVYHLRERWGAAMHAAYLGGSRTNYESINGNWNVGGWAEPGTAYDGDGSTWARLKSLRRDYAAARAWLDVPQFVDYMLVWMFGGAEDEYRCVGPTVAGSGFKFYLNDADGWLCIPQYCAAGDRTARGAPGRLAGDGPGSLFSMLFAGGQTDYRTLLADHIQRALVHEGALTPERNLARLRQRCAEVERAFVAESARWGYLTPAEWVRRRDSVLQSWFPSRTTEALAEFRSAGFLPALAAPTLNRQGGVLTNAFAVQFFAAANATVWYTLDGTDPRLPGGGVSPTARAYRPGVDAPVSLRANTLIRSRARSGAAWSALNEAFFQVGPEALGSGDVVFSELAFRPSVPEGAEFIEFLNVGGRAVNLRGARFTEGITFAFPEDRDVPLAPDQRLVLVNDLFRFQRQHGAERLVTGVYAGSLSNDGEALTLVNREGARSASVRYGTAAPWPSATEFAATAAGYTLVMSQPERASSDPLAWRPSVSPAGSPGTSDARPFAGDPGADGDADGFPALAEYFLGTSDQDSNSGPGAVVAALDATGGFTLTLMRDLAADDAALTVEESTDLANWAPAVRVTLERQGDGRAREVWSVPATNRDRVFARLRVVWRGE